MAVADAPVPFAVVTRLVPGKSIDFARIASFIDLATTRATLTSTPGATWAATASASTGALQWLR
jgi:hypothetical protein